LIANKIIIEVINFIDILGFQTDYINMLNDCKTCSNSLNLIKKKERTQEKKELLQLE